jgi:hypothetical protein
MTGIATKFVIVGALLLLLNLPLMFRMVPMNKFYGFRTRAAFQSEQNWYEINARGGKMLTVSSIIVLLVGIAGFFVPEKFTLFYIGGAVIVAVSAIVISLLCFTAWQRRFGS